MSTSTSSAPSPPRTGPTTRTSSTASTSRRTAPSWSGSTTTASATPADPSVHRLPLSHGRAAAIRQVHLRDQLVGRTPSRQAVGGLRVLLYQRLRAGHPGTAEDLPESALHRHRYPPRRRRGGGLLPDRSSHDLLLPQVQGLLPRNRTHRRHWKRFRSLPCSQLPIG